MVNESDADDMQHPHEGNYCITSCPTTTTFASFSDELQLNTANSKPRQQRLVIKATKTDDENGDMQSLPCLPTSSSACYTFDEEDEQPFSTQKQQYHDNHETATKSIATRLTVNTTGQMDDHAALKSTNDGRHASHQSQPPPPSNFKTDEKVESSCACVIM